MSPGLRLLKEFDFFRKLAPEHREEGSHDQPPPAGPVLVLRAAAAAFILLLTLTEFGTYLTPMKKQAFHLDMDGPMQLTRPRQIRVLLDVTIHEFPCIDLSLDYQDAMGNRQTDIRTGVLKQRLKKDGTPVGEVVNNDPKTAKIMAAASNPSIRNDTGNVTCGDCYGALPDGECCNTCSDVLYAYRMKRWALPRIESIKQCQQDGTSKSSYQPPQIARLQDYKAEDYFHNFKTIGSMAPAGSESGVTAPLKLNLSLNLQNITFKPLNLKPLASLHLDDGWDDWGDDYDYDDYLYGTNRKEKEANRSRSWPDCVRRNTMVNGHDIGDALMEDLTQFGAKDGCWKDNCSHTDKFNSDTMEHCAQVCEKVARCSWWTWGIEEFAATCWLRTGKRYHTKRYGFSSGSRNCTAALKLKSTTSTTTTTPSTTTTRTSQEEDPPAQPRRLSSYDDLGSDYAYGSLMHMPMFEWHDQESERRREQKGESCRIHGHFDVNRVPGNFHIGTHGASVPSWLGYQLLMS
eukprot:s5867_g1.t1